MCTPPHSADCDNLRLIFFSSTFGYGSKFLLTLLGELSVYFIPSGKLGNIIQSHVGFGARVLAFSLENAPVLSHCLWMCAKRLMWFQQPCDFKSVMRRRCNCVPVLRSVHERLLLACLNRYPVITSAALLYFTLHAPSQPTHLNIACTFRLFLTSLSCRRGEYAEIRSKRVIQMDKVRCRKVGGGGGL